MVIVYLFMLHFESTCSLQVLTILKDGFNDAVKTLTTLSSLFDNFSFIWI